MKKILLSLFILSLALWSVAQEPTPEKKKNVLGFEPIILTKSSFEINYERYFTHNLSGKLLTQLVYEVDGPAYTRGIVEDIALKVYGMKEKNIWDFGLSGYFMPYVHFSNFDILSYRGDFYDFEPVPSMPYRRSFTGYGGGVLVGMSVNFGDIIIDAYFGGGLQANNAPFNPYLGHNGFDVKDVVYGESDTFWEKKGIVPKGGIEIGFKL